MDTNIMAMVDSSHFESAEEATLDPSHYLQILKKRKFYFLIPFVLILAIGMAVAMLWPPTFLSEGKILVQSQQIPVDLVRPTVTATASERIATIEQRVMTRDNILKIVDKYQLFPNQRSALSRTEILELMRANTVIKPVELDSQRRQSENFTVAVTVGFSDRQPETATRVANELITLFLNEDARNRTSRATETTKFLEQEAQKLQVELASIDVKIAESRRQAPDTAVPQLTALKAELAQKAAVYAPSHPEVRRLKSTIEALEKVTVPAVQPAGVSRSATSGEPLDPLFLARLGVQQNLESTNQKLAAARRGENLERDQFSERLEVLEQAVPPQKPIKPNRQKLMGFSVLAALMAGFAGILAVETFDKTIRGSKDLLAIANGQLIVAIPYIATRAELRRSKRRVVLTLSAAVATLLIALAIVHFFLRPLDEIWSTVMGRLGI